MRCDEARRSIYALDDGELDRAGSDEVAVHLERCESCRNEREADRRIKALVRRQASAMPGPPPGLWSRVAACVEAERAASSGRRACRPRRRLWASASGLAAAAGVILALTVSTDVSPPADTPAGLAGQLIADHERSLRRATGPADVPSGDPAVVLARIGSEIGDIARVPRIGPDGATLVGGSVCQLRATRGIRWSYRIDVAGVLSFYQLIPPEGGGLPLPDTDRGILAAGGGTRAFVLWTDQRSLNALVGALPEAELRQLAARAGHP